MSNDIQPVSSYPDNAAAALESNSGMLETGEISVLYQLPTMEPVGEVKAVLDGFESATLKIGNTRMVRICL